MSIIENLHERWACSQRKLMTTQRGQLLMKTLLSVLFGLFLLAGCVIVNDCMAQDPVKWSAPMNDYPTQWSPTNAPPSYYNPYGYNYPYAAYGYGYQGNQYQGGYQGGHYGGQVGNPYYGYYGQ